MALNRVGCAVAAVCPPRGHPLSKTASVQFRFPYRALDPLTSLAEAIREFEPDFIIPGDDRAVQHLHELYAAGPNAFGIDCTGLIQRSLGAPASYPVVSSRFPLLEKAREAGVRVPKTVTVRSVDDLAALDPRPEAPWVLKSDGTWGGHGVAIARNREQAARSFEVLAKPVGVARALKRLMIDREAFSLRLRHQPPGDVVAQQFIRGVPANSGFFCWEGQVVASIHVEVLQAQGDTGAATVVRVIDNPEMEFAARQLAGCLGLSGFFGLDFVIEEGSGAAYVLELNPRCTPLCHLQLGGRRDMVGAVRAQLTGEPFQESPPVTRHDTIVYFPQAWHWDRSFARRPGSFHDVPWEDPGLIRELMLLPWPDRGLLARLYNRLRHTTFAERASQGGGAFEHLENAAGREATSDPIFGTLEPGPDGRVHLPPVVPLRQEGSKDPLFLIHGVDGNVFYFHRLVKHLDPGQPVYGVLAQATLGDKTVFTSMEDMAQFYLKAIQIVQPQGPYHLVGYSFGGYIAYEIGRQLRARGERVGLVGLIDTLPMAAAKGAASQGTRHTKAKLRARWLGIYALLDAMHRPIPSFLKQAYDINCFAAMRYAPQPYPGKVTLFPAYESGNGPLNDQWQRLAGEGVEVRAVPGNHDNLLSEPQVQFLGREITDCLSGTECGSEQILRT